MVSNLEFIVKVFIDKLNYIRSAQTIEEMKKRINQTIDFYEQAIGSKKMKPLTKEELNELLKKMRKEK